MTGDQLRQWRLSMGMKHQTDAADALGVPYRTYQRWERSKDVGRVVELATQAISMKRAWPDASTALKAFATLARAH